MNGFDSAPKELEGEAEMPQRRGERRRPSDKVAPQQPGPQMDGPAGGISPFKGPVNIHLFPAGPQGAPAEPEPNWGPALARSRLRCPQAGVRASASQPDNGRVPA